MKGVLADLKMIVKFRSPEEAKRAIEIYKRCNEFTSCHDCPLYVYAGSTHVVEYCSTTIHRAYVYLADNDEYYE